MAKTSRRGSFQQCSHLNTGDDFSSVTLQLSKWFWDGESIADEPMLAAMCRVRAPVGDIRRSTHLQLVLLIIFLARSKKCKAECLWHRILFNMVAGVPNIIPRLLNLTPSVGRLTPVLFTPNPWTELWLMASSMSANSSKPESLRSRPWTTPSRQPERLSRRRHFKNCPYPCAAGLLLTT
jgi:hypothetical protein